MAYMECLGIDLIVHQIKLSAPETTSCTTESVAHVSGDCLRDLQTLFVRFTPNQWTVETSRCLDAKPKSLKSVFYSVLQSVV